MKLNKASKTRVNVQDSGVTASNVRPYNSFQSPNGPLVEKIQSELWQFVFTSPFSLPYRIPRRRLSGPSSTTVSPDLDIEDSRFLSHWILGIPTPTITHIMASKVIAPFTGPLTPTANDGFAIYDATKAEKAPSLAVMTKIRPVGSQMHELSTGRADYLKYASWESFEKQDTSYFALRTFFRSSQSGLSFTEYASALADARNAVGTTLIPVNIYKYQFLSHANFRAHTILGCVVIGTCLCLMPSGKFPIV
ncbi:uncharacterized protein LACBIDRAFT_323283 [Laccaria bicolor S238N-H82]|uniref:Predicted protein n=1 Tax=Laccaria bicolor (strain S238N-H82 / ATCC MYA-4686) TaxID=486041 RepID=B0CZQ3_LACBS|nr:uncharacterized protein LACBIDRAFT_323283 [Laccaria bicolor S238N-H82]EDR12192.1 predicted protein [Laccaria bicolor S238N-H82]|eukprot:XP_001876456.1 predicted protein [Laccaria bicolor S238N-H82]